MKNSTSWPWLRKFFGDGQAGQGDTGTGAGRLVHLAEDQRALGPFGRAVIGLRVLVHAGFDHLVVKVVALAGALADAGEHRETAMGLGDVVDQLLDQHGLADAGAAEQADLAAAGVGRQKVDDLDAGHQDLRFRALVGEFRCGLVDGAACLGFDRAGLVHGLADDVHDASEGFFTDRNGNRLAGIGHFLAAHQTLCGVHGDGPDGVFSEVLGHFEDQPVAVVLGFERVEDGWQIIVERHVDDGADNLSDVTYKLLGCHALFLRSFRDASAPGLSCHAPVFPAVKFNKSASPRVPRRLR